MCGRDHKAEPVGVRQQAAPCNEGAIPIANATCVCDRP